MLLVMFSESSVFNIGSSGDALLLHSHGLIHLCQNDDSTEAVGDDVRAHEDCDHEESLPDRTLSKTLREDLTTETENLHHAVSGVSPRVGCWIACILRLS